MRSILRMRPWLSLLAGGSFLAVSALAAQPFEAGDRVEASPTFSNARWESCVVVQVLRGGDYALSCGPKRLDYVVQGKWVRPPSGAAAPMAVQSAAPVPAPAAVAARPATSTPTAQGAPKDPPIHGTYHCVAAGGVAGTLQIVIKSASRYADRNGKTGEYTYDAKSGQIRFPSGPWEGFYGAQLRAGKIGIASRPGGSYNTICDLK
ncbi:hypothetical protein BURK2_03222 [Burkholderiales bacterium]|nr:MAG: hypothetical protein F9K47_06355 [Burkholderiales bacterium]CAG1003526.1 hypothetical protein BURK2_03222 [Burkholderiales bacterium]